LDYAQNGGYGAGGITSSNTLSHSREESNQLPQLSFYRNRYYDQLTGRFTQEDPIGIAGGVNLYMYGGHNPVTFTAPFGLAPECCLTLPLPAVGGSATGVAVTAAGAIASAGSAVVGVGLLVWSNLPVEPAAARPTTATPGFAPDALALKKPEPGTIRQRITKALTTIGLIVGLLTGTEPPKKPDDKYKPPPPAPTSTKTIIPVQRDRPPPN